MLGWYLLYCKGKKEATARAYLEQRNLSCFLPEAEVECIKRGKRTLVNAPLFPNYLFVRFDPFQTPITTVLSAPGVASVVRTDGKIAPIETAIVVAIRERLKRAAVSLMDAPTAGDTVEILDGPFANLQGIFREPDGDKRSLLLLEILGQQKPISMENQMFRRL
ncbi:transcription/translation regulatory transformer protein RfaH [Ferrimonas balearica]|uniref:transcription/translation regulatory transformer protein RfaH n=1 Tax=Ferrimonas balearica TaxID=44012 RepID=UPI001C97B689|nr:transcription/translation regulatory transformer protein RfaH [Ferrimonas balearica]MBY5978941.1 transcription/translation regulatory transformer protein RfaH [Ferrimonas balearica]